MASSIGGISSSTASSIRGYGGLASGLDRDSLIESMTYATTAKIQAQKQKQQKLQWTQTSIRGISDKLIQFSQKYRSYTSSTNLSGSAFFNRTSITANGKYADKVSVTGNGSAASNISISEVKQMAVNASMAMNQSASSQALSTGALTSNLTEKMTVSTLEGQSLTFGYGNKTYGISLTSGTTSDGYTYRYGTAEEAVESINKQLAGVSISSSANTKKTLGDVVEAYVDDAGAVQLRTHGDTAGNTVTLKGGSAQAWKALGLEGTDQAVTLTDSGTSLSLAKQNLTEEKSRASLLGGKNLSFTYNGTTKSITLMSEADLLAKGDEGLKALKDDIQKKLNKEFGTGRIQVSLSANNELQFETTRPDKPTHIDPNDPDKNTYAADGSSILSLSGGSSGVLGLTGALGVDYGTSNRLNIGTSLENSGLKALKNLEGLSVTEKNTSGVDVTFTGIKAHAYNNATDAQKKDLLDGKLDFSDIKLNIKINGEDIVDNSGDAPKDLTYASSISQIMNAINSSDAGVKISYLSNADKFTMEATSSGASGRIEIGGTGAELLFGTKDETGPDKMGYSVTEGKDALIKVKYAGSNEEVELVRGSNSFSLDGMNVTLNGTFKADNSSDAITFTAKVDADKITSAVSEMITAYNEALELITKEVGTKPARGYAPLTDQQRDELSESQIEKWEEKAKEGLLFNDTDIRGLADKMRFIFPSGSEDKRLLESMGITTSNSYADNGKLVFDETKFRAVLESDPESVQQLFSRPAGTNGPDDKGGFMARVGNIFEMYASTTGSTKGILVERAGSTYAPTSILNNAIQKQLNSIDVELKKLNKRLTTETDRYISQFTYLETMISQMNSQSSYLSQLGGA